jgi:NAD(P)-dependent dehydrogenase (short-subunit alcohol dehydrogenase family)
MPTVFITGAGRGLGFEFARQYLADGWRVLATCRENASAKRLRALGKNVKVHVLDVTDNARVAHVAKLLKREAIDVLINNAGIYGPRPQPMGGIDHAVWGEVMRVNTMAPLRVCECFLDHVARSERKLIVAVTSRMGSIGENTSGGSYIYRSSKAALNAVMRSLAADLKPRGIAVAVLHPGWVRTDMGGPSAQIDAEASVAGLRRVIDRLALAQTGRFFNYDGEEIPW